MNATTMTNGRGRKSLASQLDRLDTILDGLSDGLNEAVATAVKEAVTVAVEQAVRTALCEVLTNPEVLVMLRSAAHQSHTQPKQPVRVRVRECIGKATSWVGKRLRQFGQACVAVKNRVRKGMRAFLSRVKVLKPYRMPILIALSIGLVTGVAAYFVGPWLSAVVSGLGGFATSLAVQAGLWFRRIWGSTSFSDT